MSAQECFELIASRASELQPAARGAAIAATLRQFAEICGDVPLSLADVATGYAVLARPLDGDLPPVAARRRTCAELAQIAEVYDSSGGSRTALAAVFDVIVAHFATSTDPRHVSIRETAAREVSELREVRQ